MCHQNTEISFNDLLPSATKGNITIEKDFTVAALFALNVLLCITHQLKSSFSTKNKD